MLKQKSTETKSRVRHSLVVPPSKELHVKQRTEQKSQMTKLEVKKLPELNDT